MTNFSDKTDEAYLRDAFRTVHGPLPGGRGFHAAYEAKWQEFLADNTPLSIEALKLKGFNHWSAEALADLEVTTASLKHASAAELFDTILDWHGIIGYASTIADTLDNLRSIEANK